MKGSGEVNEAQITDGLQVSWAREDDVTRATPRTLSRAAPNETQGVGAAIAGGTVWAADKCEELYQGG